MINVKSYVRISDAHDEAWLYLCPPPEGQESYEKLEILQYVKRNGVVAGINESHIAAMCKKKIYEREVKIASSEPGEEGHDGYFELFFETGKRKPKIRSDGSVDYLSMSLVENVNAGDLLAKYHPAKGGKCGRDVTGVFEKTILYKDLRPLSGKGVTNYDNPNEYYADKSGKVEYDGERKLNVVEVYEIQGDVDLANNALIEFTGDVIIHGSVESGVVIRAGKSVTIDGGVESCSITAGGDVCLRRGIQGGGKGSIDAGGDVFTEFIEYANVKAGGSVTTNVILSSHVHCGNKVSLTGKKGLIAGGSVHALMGIECVNAGNASEIRTMLHAGLEPQMIERRIAINEEYDSVNKELDEIAVGMSKILRVRQQTGELSEQLQKHLQDLKDKKDEIYARCVEIKKRADEVESLVVSAREAKIRVNGNIYHGVNIGIDSHELPIQRDTSFMEYKAQSGVIVGTVVVV